MLLLRSVLRGSPQLPTPASHVDDDDDDADDDDDDDDGDGDDDYYDPRALSQRW